MKPVKLTLNSTTEEIVETMKKEGKSVEYWHKKHYGGPAKYDKWQDGQLAKAHDLPAESELIGDLVDYHSLTTGNRWKSFEVTTSYGIGNTYTRMLSFCFWDTFGSIGAFFKCRSQANKTSVLLFTSHFFLRYADRMDIQYRDAALVSEFFVRNHVLMTKLSDDLDEKGRRQVVIVFKEGVGYGYPRKKIDSIDDMNNNDNVIEIRTFLKYEQLTTRQMQEVNEMREAAEFSRSMDDAPAGHIIGRILQDDDFVKKSMDYSAKSVGLDIDTWKLCCKVCTKIICTADFVSNNIFKAYGDCVKKGSLSAFDEMGRLQHIVTSRFREHPELKETFGWADMLDCTHEWKGDDYDWNKWLYGLLSEKNLAKCNDKVIADLKQGAVRGEHSYESIMALFQYWDFMARTH